MKKPKLKKKKYFMGYKKLKHVKMFEGFVNEQNWTKTEEALSPFQAAVWEAVKGDLKQEVVEDENFEIFYDDSEMELTGDQIQFDYSTDIEEDDEEGDKYNILSILVEKTENGIKIHKWVQAFQGNGGDDIEEKDHEAKDAIEAGKIIADYLNGWN